MVFKGDPDNVAWMADVAVDDNDLPVIAFSVQKDGGDKPQCSGGLDHHHLINELALIIGFPAVQKYGHLCKTSAAFCFAA